jgi:N-acetylneuraminic acid mutarotase
VSVSVLMVLSAILAQSITWTTKTPIPAVRSAPGCAVWNDTVYVIGGSSGGTSLHNTNYVYDPAMDSWSTKASMPTPRSQLGCAVVNGKIYAIGGFVGGMQTDTNIVEEYDPVSNSWTLKSPMPTSRYAFAIAVVANKIYVMGGMLPIVATVEEYDPSADTASGTPWHTKTSMPTRRMGPACAVIRDSIFVYGGSYNVGSKDTLVNECYDPVTDNWSTRANMPFNRYASGGFAYDNEAYSVGGYNYSSYFSNVDVYDPVANSWSSETPMNYARQSVAVGLIGNKVYVIGGWNNAALAYNEEGSFPATAIEHISIDAFVQDYRVELRWTVSYSGAVCQFIIKRSGSRNGEYAEIARIPGSGYTPLPQTYSYCDEAVVGGKRYYYKLGVVEDDGNATWYGPVYASLPAVKPSLSISPNPFIKQAIISLVGESGNRSNGESELRIYDITGRLVKTLSLPTAYSLLPIGVVWDAKGIAPGIYFVALQADNFLIKKKAIILR